MRPFPTALWMSTSLVAALSLGCGGSEDEGSDPALRDESALLDAGLCQPDGEEGDDAAVPPVDTDAGVEVDAGPRPNPDLPYIADVKANGTGCPAGTWVTSITPDGNDFAIEFAGYEAQLGAKQSVAVKDCIISLRIKSPENLSYALTNVTGGGYALLDEGVSAFHTFRTYFQGNPAAATEERRTNYKGPYDDSYDIGGPVPLADQTWSPCGLERLLQVQTRVQLRRDSGSGEGYINLGKLSKLKLSWQKC